MLRVPQGPNVGGCKALICPTDYNTFVDGSNTVKQYSSSLVCDKNGNWRDGSSTGNLVTPDNVFCRKGKTLKRVSEKSFLSRQSMRSLRLF